MFDAKSLLENLVKGAGQPAAQGQQGGGLDDLLRGLMGGGAPQATGAQATGAQAAPSAGGGLADILGKMMQGAGGGQGAAAGGKSGGGLDDILRQMLPGGGVPASGQANAAPASGQGGGGGLADILGKLQGQGGQGLGGLADILGQVFAQATQGVKEGAQRVDDATGVGGKAKDVFSQATGQSPDELIAKLKELIAQNQFGAGAAAGGLGSILLGTRAGRSLAGHAIKLGGLALIGGLAYKALQNYQQGKPLLGPSGQASALAAAPSGSGFETGAITNDAALLYIRGMIAAAAADGRIDDNEQQKILGGLDQAGLGPHADAFLRQELANPATTDELAAAVSSEQEAVQLFTAARVAVDVGNEQEHDFLVDLAAKLGLDDKLVAHIDAAARGV